jgi:hypothetical protein
LSHATALPFGKSIEYVSTPKWIGSVTGGEKVDRLQSIGKAVKEILEQSNNYLLVEGTLEAMQ